MQVKFIRNAGDCRNWLIGYVSPLETMAERLTLINELTVRIADAQFSANVSFKLLELIREPVVTAAEQLFRAAQSAELPLPNHLLEDLAVVDESMEKTGKAYQTTYELSESIRDRPGAQSAGASNSFKHVLPLTRALDMQSRRIAGRLRSRVVVDESQWAGLALLAREIRKTTFLDEKLTDPLARFRPVTARALFTYPILMSIAGCHARSTDESQLIEILARRWAQCVGFRVDSGNTETRSNPYGPSLRLASDWFVRLDTHRLLASMSQCCDQWEQSLRANPEKSESDLHLICQICSQLRSCWSAAWRMPEVQSIEQAPMRVCVGLPDEKLTGMTSGEGIESSKFATYTYGQYERSELVDSVDDSQKASSSVAEVFRSVSQKASLVQLQHQRLVIERRAPLPSAVRDGLIAVSTDTGASGIDLGNLGKGLRLGRIRSVEHLLVGQSNMSGVRLQIDPIDGQLHPVVINSKSRSRTQRAYLLATENDVFGKGPTVFVEPGSLLPGSHIRLTRTGEQISVEVGELLEQGPGFDRFSVTAQGSSRL